MLTRKEVKIIQSGRNNETRMRASVTYTTKVSCANTPRTDRGNGLGGSDEKGELTLVCTTVNRVCEALTGEAINAAARTWKQREYATALWVTLSLDRV